VIDCQRFHGLLLGRGLDFFTGVPDSLLKDLCACIRERTPADRHVVAANEGAAVAMAIGHYLGRGKPAVVYLQNSGLGNAVNPLVSLADEAVYGIPMLLVVGWRGEPGRRDEPQHAKQGPITLGMLDLLGIPHRVLGPDDDPEAALDRLCRLLAERSQPAALVVREGTFAPFRSAAPAAPGPLLAREAAIALIADRLGPGDLVVATTGKASRELYEHRRRSGAGHGRDFLTVGGMGHASAIALGIALARPSRPVVCLDGDGAALMHLGTLAVNASLGATNFKHIILNNGCHDSVGGLPTVAGQLSLAEVARACGYRSVRRVDDPARLVEAVLALVQEPGPALLEVRVAPGARSDLGRPREAPAVNMREFMAGLEP
jgi:phosphonopyruvate decarboxylase